MPLHCTSCGKEARGQQSLRCERLFWKSWAHCSECRLIFENRLTAVVGTTLLIAAAAVIFLAATHHFSPVGYLFMNAVLFGGFVLAGILPHELGHAILARRAGLLVREITVGRGRDILFLPIAGFRVRVRLIPMSGFAAFAHYSDTPNLRRKYLAAVAAGPAANLTIALIALPFALGSQASLIEGFPVAALIAISQTFIALCNLVPDHVITSQGVKVPSDGLSILQLLFSKHPEVLGRSFEISSIPNTHTTTSSSGQ